MKGDIKLISGDVQIIWPIVEGGLSIRQYKGFDILSFFLQSEEPSSISLGQYSSAEGIDEVEYIKNEPIVMQVQYRLSDYSLPKLIGTIFREEEIISDIDDAVNNGSNICLHYHESIYGNSIEFIGQIKEEYILKLEGFSNSLSYFFSTGLQTKIEVNCTTQLSERKAEFWNFGDEIL